MPTSSFKLPNTFSHKSKLKFISILPSSSSFPFNEALTHNIKCSILPLQQVDSSSDRFLTRERVFVRDYELKNYLDHDETNRGLMIVRKEEMKKKKLYLGENIHSLMKEHRLTLRELATKCGVPYSSLCHMKNNRPPRNVEHIAKIASCLGVSLYYLLWKEHDPHELQTIISKEVLSGVFEIIIKRQIKN